MINIEEVSKKIEDVINGRDIEIDDSPGIYDFSVFTEGFHLNHVYNMDNGENFIPVFISALGGEYNPIVGLEEQNYTTSITFYFPIRLKTEMHHINKFLYDCFCGRILTYGTQKARSNISVAQFGEIQDMDLEQFKSWVENTYKKPIKTMEPWMSMTINLYLTTVKNLNENDGFMYGESLSIPKIEYDGQELENLTYMTHTSNLSSEPYSEQILGETLHKTIISGSSQVFEIPFYLRIAESYKKLFEDFIYGEIANKEVKITFNFLGNEYERKCIVQNASIHAQLGELLGISLTVSLKVD